MPDLRDSLVRVHFYRMRSHGSIHSCTSFHYLDEQLRRRMRQGVTSVYFYLLAVRAQLYTALRVYRWICTVSMNADTYNINLRALYSYIAILALYQRTIYLPRHSSALHSLNFLEFRKQVCYYSDICTSRRFTYVCNFTTRDVLTYCVTRSSHDD